VIDSASRNAHGPARPTGPHSARWAGDRSVAPDYSIKRLVDATLSAFPDTQIVVAAANPEITRLIPGRSVKNDKNCVSEISNRWKIASVT
jgi:hypothetical protein